MPRIMGIGAVSKLSGRHKPKRAGAFRGIGRSVGSDAGMILLEGDPKKARKYAGMKGVRGTPAEHSDNYLQHKRTLDSRMASAAKGSCPAALMAVYTAGRLEEAARGMNPQGTVTQDAAQRTAEKAQRYVLKNCGCGAKK